MGFREDVKRMKALTDENRLAIMLALQHGEKCGCDLLEELNITQPTLSHHMKILVESGMVNDRKEGKWHYYSLNTETFNAFKEYIEKLGCKCSSGEGDGCCK